MSRNCVCPSGLPLRRGTLHRMQDAGQRDFARIGHVGVPTLARVGQPERPALGITPVRQHHDFRQVGITRTKLAN